MLNGPKPKLDAWTKEEATVLEVVNGLNPWLVELLSSGEVFADALGTQLVPKLGLLRVRKLLVFRGLVVVLFAVAVVR
jgi:hypothetical protein